MKSFALTTAILLLFLGTAEAKAQFVVKKADGSIVSIEGSEISFAPDADGVKWSIGDEYVEDNDLDNILFIRPILPKRPFDSSLYYGRSLLDENEQKAYDFMLAAFLGFAPDPDNPNAKRIAVNFTEAGIDITYEQLLTIGKYMQYDEPRLLMLQSIVPKGDATQMVSPPKTGPVGTVYYDTRFFNVNTAYTIQTLNSAKIEVAASEILDKIEPDMNEAQKFRLIHDEFIKLVSYGGMSTGNSGSIEGAFIPNSLGVYAIVCQGYAKGLQYLCLRAGIPAIYVTGTANYNPPPVDHAWNMVKIDGEWYNVDATNDDPPTGATVQVRYEDFLQCNDDFLHDHTPGVTTAGTADSFPAFPETASQSYPLEETEYP